MSDFALTLKALGARIQAPFGRWANRRAARGAHRGTRNTEAELLPDGLLLGDSDRAKSMLAGRWQALGREIDLGSGSIWDTDLSSRRLEAARHSFTWLDDLAAHGNRTARTRAQDWVQEWIERYGTGTGPGWDPEIAGRRAKRWAAHAGLLTRDLERKRLHAFWRALAAQRNYLARRWDKAPTEIARLRALTGLVWAGVVVPHPGHEKAIADLGALAGRMIDADGGVATRAPEDLAETLILLIWTARVLEDARQEAAPGHLDAIVRAVPVLRPLRLGDGRLAQFNGGGPGDPHRIDQALAELRMGVQPKPALAMGFCRLSGGRISLVLDAAAPPLDAAPTRAHAGTLSFEMAVGRTPLMVNAGPGAAFGKAAARDARRTAAHTAVEIGNVSSSRLRTDGLAAATFGARLSGGPSMVAVNQAHDSTGQWLLATHDGYIESHGVLVERRLFADARGTELRGEDILTVPDARARARFEHEARAGAPGFAVRFHIHPDVNVEFDYARQMVFLFPGGGETWVFRANGGRLAVEDTPHYDPGATEPRTARQVVVRGEFLAYLGQVIWSLERVETPEAGAAPA